MYVYTAHTLWTQYQHGGGTVKGLMILCIGREKYDNLFHGFSTANEYIEFYITLYANHVNYYFGWLPFTNKEQDVRWT